MHYYQFNIGDYASHTKGLSLLEDLAYRRLLDHYYLAEQPFNGSSTDVARLIGMREYVDEVDYVLRTFFILDDESNWRNPRADQEIQAFKRKSENASKAGKRSAATRLNGGSTDVQQSLNERQLTNNHKPITNKKESLQPIEGLDLDAWERWLDYRKEIKKPIKVASMQSAMKAFVKHGTNQAQVVEQSIANGWTGLFELKDQSAQLKHTKPFDVWDQPYIPLSQR